MEKFLSRKAIGHVDSEQRVRWEEASQWSCVPKSMTQKQSCIGLTGPETTKERMHKPESVLASKLREVKERQGSKLERLEPKSEGENEAIWSRFCR